MTEGYVLSTIFGNCPQVKILETFAENYNDKLYVADIARITGISRITITEHVNRLLTENIIIESGIDGRIQYYQLNMENPKSKIILLLERYIISEKLGELIPKNEDAPKKEHYSIEEMTSIIKWYIEDSKKKKDEVQDPRSKAYFKGMVHAFEIVNGLVEGDKR